jgi:hypothetical protein
VYESCTTVGMCMARCEEFTFDITYMYLDQSVQLMRIWPLYELAGGGVFLGYLLISPVWALKPNICYCGDACKCRLCIVNPCNVAEKSASGIREI